MRSIFVVVLAVLMLCSCGSKQVAEEETPIRLFSDSIAYYSSSYWGYCERDPETGQWTEWDIDSIHPAVVAFDGVCGRYYTFLLQNGQYSLRDYFNTDSLSGNMILHPSSNMYQVVNATSETNTDSLSVVHFWCSSVRLFDGENVDPNTDVAMTMKGEQMMFRVITDNENWFFDGIAFRDVSGPRMDWLIQTLNLNSEESNR